MQKTLGGDRLGSGKKMKVDLHGFGRSTHDMGYLWRSTMAAGTLVPFMNEVGLPGDTFDINLDVDIKTHPTIGPLFGSYKVQVDVFECPIRLYNGKLHNNKVGIGLNMATVKLPQMTLFADPTVIANLPDEGDIDNVQINPSCILSYLGIRGVGMVDPTEPDLVPRLFNAVPLLAYWDIYKNYYANKQEEIGYVVHKETPPITETIDLVRISPDNIPQAPSQTSRVISTPELVSIDYIGATPRLDEVVFNTDKGQYIARSVALTVTDNGSTISFNWNTFQTGTVVLINWNYISNSDLVNDQPEPYPFALSEIDEMREELLVRTIDVDAIDITQIGLNPFSLLLAWQSNRNPYMGTQEGLGLKTYQSDYFNNWLKTTWIDGPGGINEITAISTASGDMFTIDTLNLAKKVYDMLNRIAVSGGTYYDWMDAVWSHDRFMKAETPIYHGGLSKELIFQEVISNSESAPGANTSQPLGTLAGKGAMAKKHKGGSVTIKVNEPCYIMGIISLTPRVDYSQGNKWDTMLKTMDDFHKPSLDEIGFQELITEQMGWWTTHKQVGANPFQTRSAGKQPAWMQYMTNVNQVRGNFAIRTNEMFMTLNRRYEWNGAKGETSDIQDLTTYIDPTKYNQIFAQTSLDAQNFWTQIAVDITARRVMSAKVMPNL
ncbi:MAG: major capsid protein [Microviridae sp.]|nr:MAG: major capsid protein [Microviridae sp.]